MDTLQPPPGDLPERETMSYDVVVVGAGPAGLSAAISIKQRDPGLSVVVIEKASEIGGHILSGAVIDPSGLDQLLPNWREEATFTRTPVEEDIFRILTPTGGGKIPAWMFPKLMSNEGCFIASLSDVCRFLGDVAQSLDVEIYPGFAAAELLQDEAGRVIGVATGDMGVDKDGNAGPAFQRGMALLGRYTILAEGARGSLSRQAIERFDLARDASPQKFGLGIKELWSVDPSRHRPGRVEHSMGWPLDRQTAGGSFLYHFGDNMVAVGFVVHLDYKNPYLSPFEEFQRFKTHAQVRDVFEGAKRVEYGARVIASGGWQSVPKLDFPGGLLIGDSAGFVNVPRIKGSHNAVHSGILAAGHVIECLQQPEASAWGDINAAWRNGPIGKDLRPVRNVKPLWSRHGILGVLLGGADMWCQTLIGLSPFGTLKHRKADHEALEPASLHTPIPYAKPDGVLTFDRLSSVYISNTNHAESQPAHLKLVDPALQHSSEKDVFAGPSTRFCPAGVYEWIEEPAGPRFQINAQNCVHCKTCDIKDPNLNIVWQPPEGGGGPNYASM